MFFRLLSKRLSLLDLRRHLLRPLTRGALLIACVVGSPGVFAGPGAEMYNEFLEKGVIYPDQEWQDYVTEVGERLLANSPHAGRNYTFVVVDLSLIHI